MIGRLRGLIVSDTADNTVLVDVHGVGYEVHLPLGAAGRMAREPDGTQIVHVHTVFRQDALELFGFASELERACFRSLIGVPNVGPKTALGLLTAMSPSELGAAVEAGDIGRLSKAPGIGKRTAERIVVELKGKLGALAASGPETASKSKGTGGTSVISERLVAALTNMGYRPAEAARAVEQLGERIDSRSLAELLREALGVLTR
jgi:Holliday junction DNA helicase RuvA